MKSIRKLEDLKVYQDARILVSRVFQYTRTQLPKSEYDLNNQIKRSALSITANIAEGFERDGNKEFRQFLAVAKGSVGELRSHLHVCNDLSLIDEQEYLFCTEKALEVSRQLSGLIRYIQATPVMGRKYK